MFDKIGLKIHKLLHWEYWAQPFVYVPILPVWFFYSIKARSFFFFNAANPTIKNGGMAMESKKEIYDLIPSKYIPKTLLIKCKSCVNNLLSTISDQSIQFPFIVKPDIGMKAFGVVQVHNESELRVYHKKINIDYLIQEYIPFEREAGIFYCRIPGETMGRITGVVLKEFLTVIGNGEDTLLQLIKQNPRSHFQLKSLKKMYGDKFGQVLALNEKLVLVPFGSHTRGALFTDSTPKVTDLLTVNIDSVCKQISGFYYGRIDIMYASWEELCEGRNFSIVEVNGAGSEPTHIYDPSHSLFFAWKEIIKHWRLLYKVSQLNNKKGHNYLSFKQGREMFRANKKLELELKNIY